MSKVLIDRELLERICTLESMGLDLDEECRQIKIALAQPIASGLVPDVDDLSNFIRGIDGSKKMGAGALAERIYDWLASPREDLDDLISAVCVNDDPTQLRGAIDEIMAKEVQE
jgi:hypothetical protein